MAEAGSRSRTDRQGSTVDEIFNCSICHNEMEDSSITLCGHRFCTECIKKWIRQNQSCPQCRQPVTPKTLAEDKSFKEFKRKYKEAKEQSENNQRGQGNGMSVEELGNILQSVMPQRDQDMRNLTDNLISMKNQEISRLEQNKREQAATIGRLKDEIERLKGQLGDELPTLTERSTHLQNKVDTLTEQNRQFQDKIRTLEASLSSLKAGSLQAQQHRKNLEEQLKAKTKEMLTVKAQFDGVNKENLHLKLQLQSTKDDLKSQKEQLEKSESTTTQLKELLDQMFQQKQLSDAELDASRQSCLQLTEQVQQLHMYEVMYSEASQQLDYLNNTVVPQKDSAIDQLQQKITDLIDEVAVLQRNNIPQAEHYEILQTRLEETRQEHKQYCEDKYGTKMASLERRNEAMKKHVTELETELKNREDVGDELKAATRTYKGLIKENCDLKDKVKTLEKQNKHVAHYKERANNLERQISVLRNRIEE